MLMASEVEVKPEEKKVVPVLPPKESAELAIVLIDQLASLLEVLTSSNKYKDTLIWRLIAIIAGILTFLAAARAIWG